MHGHSMCMSASQDKRRRCTRYWDTSSGTGPGTAGAQSSPQRDSMTLFYSTVRSTARPATSPAVPRRVWIRCGGVRVTLCAAACEVEHVTGRERIEPLMSSQDFTLFPHPGRWGSRAARGQWCEIQYKVAGDAPGRQARTGRSGTSTFHITRALCLPGHPKREASLACNLTVWAAFYLRAA